MESITEFGINLPRVIPVEPAEGLAVVEFDAAVGDVQGVKRGGESLTKVLPQGKIKGCVLREVVAGIRLTGEGIAEAGAVVNVSGGVGPPRESDVAPDIESVALVVIQRKERSGR